MTKEELKKIKSLTVFFTELFAKTSKVRIQEKKFGWHKTYNILKTNKVRLKIPFASCYSDISYLLGLKNITKMWKSSFWQSASPGRTVRRSERAHQFSPWETVAGGGMLLVLRGPWETPATARPTWCEITPFSFYLRQKSVLGLYLKHAAIAKWI